MNNKPYSNTHGLATEIFVYDSKARKKRIFVPNNPSNIKMYVCGPTVYDRSHIGNARSAIVFDILYRILIHKYGKESILYSRNFTDIDDKIMQRSNETGLTINDITNKNIDWYHSDMDALNVIRPTYEPRATDSISDIFDLISKLISSGNAYTNEGHVLFDVSSYDEYGTLSGRTLEGSKDHPELNVYKRNSGDFVLWKPSHTNQAGWDSPFGRGRPGWHIECSAMSYKTLGDQLDIHGGGIDLKFPHHENEIAQSECAHGHLYGNYWVHNEMITIDGVKMSKSLGNIIATNFLIGNYDPLAVRYLILGTHYRKPLDYTNERLDQYQRELKKWTYATENVGYGKEDIDFMKFLYNDMNVPGAISVMRLLYKEKNFESLKTSMNMLGLVR